MSIIPLILPSGSGSGGGATIGGAVGGGTPGSVLFVGVGPTLAEDNANFFWHATNKTLALGTNSPDSMAILDLVSTTKTLILTSCTNVQRDLITPREGGLLYDNVFKMPFFRGQFATWYGLYVPYTAANFFGAAQLTFAEQGQNGSNKTTLKTQDNLAADNTVTLPFRTGTLSVEEVATTVALLPAATVAYRRAFVSDASSPVFGSTVTGGGAVKCPVYSDGTNWIVG